jgi:hypothetical protein
MAGFMGTGQARRLPIGHGLKRQVASWEHRREGERSVIKVA